MNLNGKNLERLSATSSDQAMISHNYFDNHPAMQAGTLPVLPALNAFIGNTWPMSHGYYNPFWPVWLLQIVDLRLLQLRPSWFVRDGLIPLLWFFKLHPRPPKFKTKLYVEESLARFIPKEWAPFFGTYRLHSQDAPPVQARSVVIGIAVENYASVSFVEKKIRAVAKAEAEAGSLGTDLFTFTKIAGQDEREQTFHASYFKKLFSHVPEPVRIMTYNELRSTFDMQKVRVWDLNEKLLLADNTMVHELLKKGGYWAETRAVAEGEEFRKISPHHGIVVNEKIDSARGCNVAQSIRAFSDFHESVQDIFTSQAFQIFPWPTWFTEWAKAQQDAEESPVKKSAKPLKRLKRKLTKVKSKKR